MVSRIQRIIKYIGESKFECIFIRVLVSDINDKFIFNLTNFRCLNEIIFSYQICAIRSNEVIIVADRRYYRNHSAALYAHKKHH